MAKVQEERRIDAAFVYERLCRMNQAEANMRRMITELASCGSKRRIELEGEYKATRSRYADLVEEWRSATIEFHTGRRAVADREIAELQSELADRGRVYAASPTFETREAFLAIRDQVDEWTTVQANAHGAIHEANRRASAAKTAFKITA